MIDPTFLIFFVNPRIFSKVVPTLQSTSLRIVPAKTAPRLRAWHWLVPCWPRLDSYPESRQACRQIRRETAHGILCWTHTRRRMMRICQGALLFLGVRKMFFQTLTCHIAFKRSDNVEKRTCSCMYQRNASRGLLLTWHVRHNSLKNKKRVCVIVCTINSTTVMPKCSLTMVCSPMSARLKRATKSG